MLFFPFGILQLISIVVPFGVLSNRSWCKNKVKVATIPVTSHCKSDMVRYDLGVGGDRDTDCAFAGGLVIIMRTGFA